LQLKSTVEVSSRRNGHADYPGKLKICLAIHYNFVMVAQTCRLAEVETPQSVWSGLRLPFCANFKCAAERETPTRDQRRQSL